MKTSRMALALTAGATLFLLGCQTPSGSMASYEYRVETMNNYVGNDGLQQRLNAMAEQGWVIDHFADHHDYYRLIMKRPRK